MRNLVGRQRKQHQEECTVSKILNTSPRRTPSSFPAHFLPALLAVELALDGSRDRPDLGGEL